jgi:hypothetical protein
MWVRAFAEARLWPALPARRAEPWRLNSVYL